MSQKLILITGSSTGIGRATAKLAHVKGYRVVVHDKTDNENLQSIHAELDGSVKVCFDISDKEAVKNGIETIKNDVGAIDVLVNGAGIKDGLKPFEELTDEDILRDYQVNVLGHIHVIQEMLPLMHDGSSIVNVTSIRALRELAVPRSLVYSMHKAALSSLTVSLAKQLAPRGIRVNAVAPGHTKTPFIKNWDASREEESLDHSLAKRLAEPEDIAEAILFVAEAKHMFGQMIVVDGGYSVGK